MLLAGCGAGWLFGPGERREAWRDLADDRCLASGVAFRAGEVKRARRVPGRGACGIPKPLEVASLGGGEVALDPPSTFACPVVPATDRWLRETVQPAAIAFLGSPVAEVEVAASYSCRRRNGVSGARISEHAFGNAIDVSGFTLADGRTISVRSGWNGDIAEGLFLREVHGGACGPFTTVLGPDADAHHADHFHFDLARHSKDGRYRSCR